MHHPAGSIQRLRNELLGFVPLGFKHFPVFLLELIKLAFGFEVDFQLGNVDIPGVSEVPHKTFVHDLSHRLVAADAAVS